MATMTKEEQKRTLIVQILAEVHPITTQILREVFGQYGLIEEITSYPEFDYTLIRYQSEWGANLAYDVLQAQCIYEDCCPLGLRFCVEVDGFDIEEDMIVASGIQEDIINGVEEEVQGFQDHSRMEEDTRMQKLEYEIDTLKKDSEEIKNSRDRMTEEMEGNREITRATTVQPIRSIFNQQQQQLVLQGSSSTLEAPFTASYSPPIRYSEIELPIQKAKSLKSWTSFNTLVAWSFGFDSCKCEVGITQVVSVVQEENQNGAAFSFNGKFCEKEVRVGILAGIGEVKVGRRNVKMYSSRESFTFDPGIKREMDGEKHLDFVICLITAEQSRNIVAFGGLCGEVFTWDFEVELTSIFKPGDAREDECPSCANGLGNLLPMISLRTVSSSNNISSSVKLWEIMKGTVVEGNGEVFFKAQSQQLFEIVSILVWFTVDTRLHSLSVLVEFFTEFGLFVQLQVRSWYNSLRKFHGYENDTWDPGILGGEMKGTSCSSMQGLVQWHEKSTADFALILKMQFSQQHLEDKAALKQEGMMQAKLAIQVKPR